VGNYADAHSHLQQGLARFRQLQEKDGIVYALQYLGDLALARIELGQAEAWLKESLAVAKQMGHRSGSADALLGLGRVAIQKATFADALDPLQESLTLYQALGQRIGIVRCCEQLAVLAQLTGQSMVAQRLEGVASELSAVLSSPSANLATTQTPVIEQTLTLLVEHIRINPLAPPPATGSLQPVFSPAPSAPLPTNASALQELTTREIEVLRLIARGLTYAQIAEQLVISPRTVDAHLRAIYNKLGVRSRHEAALIAQQLGLGGG
jgi:DNA-binding NarL/FixJ family response regulator